MLSFNSNSLLPMKKDITELFVFLDDFVKSADNLLAKNTLQFKQNKPTRRTTITMSEMLTIIILYHQSPCKNFKFFYNSYLQLYKSDLTLVSYERFVILQKRTTIYLMILLHLLCNNSQKTGIYFIDSTSLNVCHGKRISKNKVFKNIAKIGKSSKGWFYGFKLHTVINDRGEIQSACITTGNVDDRVCVENMVKSITGLLFGDKGYIKSALFETLYSKGLKLVTKVKNSMKKLPVYLHEKLLLKKRSIIETVFDFLKNKFEIEHTRHRSIANFFVHILSILVAYSFKTTKPKIRYNNALSNF